MVRLVTRTNLEKDQMAQMIVAETFLIEALRGLIKLQ
jgi:hypothetical protein